MMLAMLGMAVGTGNIWRFPRIAAQNGGGEFLVAWVVFLFLWSVPLILLEFAMGRHFRSGPVRAFGRMMGPRWAWMGAFGAFVGVAILFYYSVVAGLDVQVQRWPRSRARFRARDRAPSGASTHLRTGPS